MEDRVNLKIRMTLLSDAIFGSGMSIPGGEDIAVIQDEEGYPYLPGSAFKGMLRESLENYLCWTGGSEDTLMALCGQEGWNGVSRERRLQLTSLTLLGKPQDPARCYVTHGFTAIDKDGVVKEGTLRQARAIRSGLTFGGTVSCLRQDLQLVANALGCIKWAGGMHSRGFGQIRMEYTEAQAEAARDSRPTGTCIRYQLHTELPLIITDAARSEGYQYETQSLIPGSALRGLVLSSLSQQEPQWFEDHRRELLQQVRFLDAMPTVGDKAPLPAIMGFYEDKDETHFTSVVTAGAFAAGDKRAKIGRFCSPEGSTLKFWAPHTGGITRIQRNLEPGEDTRPFQIRYLSQGQDFEGYILTEDPAVTEKLLSVLPDTVFLGADRFAGFGQCRLTFPEACTEPRFRQQYGFTGEGPRSKVLYLLAVSPFTMVNALGEPCGLDAGLLARKLGVSSVELSYCSTSIGEYSGYNRTWQCRDSVMRMYDRGSLFRLVCSEIPSLSAVRSLQQEGLGLRRAEGFGQILFLRDGLLENITGKQSLQQTEENTDLQETAALRRTALGWISRMSREVRSCDLSASQLGTIQSFLNKAACMDGDCRELNEFLDGTESRGPVIAQKHRKIRRILDQVLSVPLGETLGCPVPDSTVAKLELLDTLIDHSRKGGR